MDEAHLSVNRECVKLLSQTLKSPDTQAPREKYLWVQTCYIQLDNQPSSSDHKNRRSVPTIYPPFPMLSRPAQPWLRSPTSTDSCHLRSLLLSLLILATQASLLLFGHGTHEACSYPNASVPPSFLSKTFFPSYGHRLLSLSPHAFSPTSLFPVSFLTRVACAYSSALSQPHSWFIIFLHSMCQHLAQYMFSSFY